MLYKTQGHLDVQLSRLFGLTNPWPLEGKNTAIKNLALLFSGLGKMISYPYLILAGAGLVYGFKKARQRFLLLYTSILFLTVFVFFIGADPRFFVLFSPFLAISIGYFVNEIIMKKEKLAKIGITILTIYLVLFLFRSHNFLHITKHQGWLVSSHISENYGFSQLDKFLDTYTTTLITKENLKTYDGARELKKKKMSLTKYRNSPNKVATFGELNHIFIFDDGINWFARNWLFDRRTFYHNLPFYSSRKLLEIERERGESMPEITYHLIKATPAAKLEPDWSSSGSPGAIEEYMISEGVEPQLIYNSRSDIAFKIYALNAEFQFAEASEYGS